MQGIDLSYAIGLPPKEAIEYFKGKGYTFSWDWQDTVKESHAKAFTVAKVLRMDILQDIRGEVQRALDEGITFEEFRRDLEPRLKAKGWWGKKMVGDGQGGQMVQLGSPHRLRTIYGTNLQTAYMTGRKKALLENAEDRPYWMYVAVLDGKTRPAHRAMHGKVFHHEDPVWKLGPPFGFRCRCRVRALSKARLDEKIKNGEAYLDSSEGKINEGERLLSMKTGEMETYQYFRTVDPSTGKDIKFFADPGWGYDGVEAAWFPKLDKYDYSIAKKWVEGGLTGPDFKAFYDGEVGGSFPVAVLNEEYRTAIGAKSQTVYLSDETLKKQKGLLPDKGGHPELLIKEYQKLPQIIEAAQTILQDGELTLVFVKVEGRTYQAVAKATQSGKALFLTSFRRLDNARKEIERLIRNKEVKVLKDEL